MTEEGQSENGTTTRVVRRGRILGVSGKLEERPASIPGPDGPIEVLVRELTGMQAREFERALAVGADAPLGLLLQMCLIDPDSHELLFEPADRQALEGIGVSKLRPLIAIAQELSGISEDDVRKARESLGRGPSI